MVPLETIMFSVSSRQLCANLTAILPSHQDFWRTLYITEEKLLTLTNASKSLLFFIFCL